MAFNVEFTEEFRAWYEDTLEVAEQQSVAYVVEMLEDAGPNLRFPFCSGIGGSRFRHMRELRVQHEGRPYRILYAFDPGVRPCCSSVAIRRATVGGTTR